MKQITIEVLVQNALRLADGRSISFQLDEDGYVYNVRNMNDILPLENYLMLYCPGIEGNQKALLCPRREDCFTEEEIENWFRNENPCQDDEPEFNGTVFLR